MTQIYEGKMDAKGLKLAVVISRFNEFVTERLLSGAVNTIIRHNGSEKDIDIIKVPGSYELLFAVKKAAERGKYDAIIALGAIIRGQTSHYEFLSSAVINNLITISLDKNVPVSSGILTTETLEQAIERAGSKAGNRGSEAVLSAIDMANLTKILSKKG